MKRFKFSLDTVLKVRKLEEKEQQKVFARLNAEFNQMVKHLEEIYALRKETLLAVANQGNNFDQRKYLVHMRFAEKLIRDIELLRAEIIKFEKRLNQERDKLIEIVQKRKILENLREKKRAEYFEYIRIEEQKELDDIAQRKRVI